MAEYYDSLDMYVLRLACGNVPLTPCLRTEGEDWWTTYRRLRQEAEQRAIDADAIKRGREVGA